MQMPKSLSRRRMLTMLATGAAATALPKLAAAADYPSRPLTLVVPFAAGGGTDGTARVLANALSLALGQPLVVENRPAAGGVLSVAQVAAARPDGYTLLWANTTTLGIAPYLYHNVAYDPVDSFYHISRAATGPLVLVVNPAVPARDVSELIALAKSRPGVLNFGSAGNGTVNHLCTEYFKSRTGTDIVHVPYKGNGPALTDIMTGQIQMLFGGMGQLVPYVKSGKVRALAVASAKRHHLLPDLPTFAEAGISDFVIMEWFGLVAPAGVPQNVADRLSEGFRTAAATESVRNLISGYGYDAISETPQEFRAAVTREGARWKAVIKSLGLTA